MRRHHAGKRHALLLPARESCGIAVGKIGQTENAQIALGELFARGGVTRVLYTGAYVIGHCHVRKQLIVLEQQSAFARLGRQVDARRRVKKGHAVDDNLALVGRLHTGDAAQRTALAATRGAQQGHALLAGLKLHVEHKPGITFLNIQNERHSLSTSPRRRIITHGARPAPRDRYAAHRRRLGRANRPVRRDLWPVCAPHGKGHVRDTFANAPCTY